MKKLVYVSAVLLAVDVLVGCASQPDPVTSGPATPDAESETTFSPEHAYCDSFARSMQNYADVLADITSDKPLDGSKWGDLSRQINELNSLNVDDLPMGWSFDHLDYVSAFEQIETALAGDGSLTLTTTDWKTGSVSLLERCVAAGFKVS